MFASHMYISLPSPVLSSSIRRRPPLTPPSGAPPYVTTSNSSVTQCSRDRCRSPSRTASAYLARVASSPSSPTLSSLKDTSSLPTPSYMSTGMSPSNSPTEGGRFPFETLKRVTSMYDAPEGMFDSNYSCLQNHFLICNRTIC